MRNGDELALQAESVGDGEDSFGIPLVLVVIGALLGVVGIVLWKRTPAAAVASPTAGAPGVIGHIESAAPVEQPPSDGGAEAATAAAAGDVAGGRGDGDAATGHPDPENPTDAEQPAPKPSLAPPVPPDDEGQTSPSWDPVVESPEPGWYADPHDRTRLRWWDGDDWTAHTRDDEETP